MNFYTVRLLSLARLLLMRMQACDVTVLSKSFQITEAVTCLHLWKNLTFCFSSKLGVVPEFAVASIDHIFVLTES